MSKRITHRTPMLAAALALTFVCGPHRLSRAGDDADRRRELMRQIEDKVEDVADALEALSGASSTRPLDDARALAYEIKRLASELGDVAGDDSEARRIADRYDDDMDGLTREVTPALGALWQGQHHADPEAQMCTERDRELVRQANDYQNKNDPDGLTELPKLASQYQDATRQAIEQARRDDDQLDDVEDDAVDYSADGGLRDIDSAAATAARTMYTAAHRSEEAAEKACENLLKGVEHPEVRETLAKLGSSAGGRKALIEQLEKDARELASTIERVSDDSGMGTVERAKALVVELERGVDNLGRTATTDRTTKVVLDKWPDAIKQMKAALDGLEHLKQHQHDMDPLPEKCEQRKRDLDEAVARNGDDKRGVETLPKLAEELAGPVRGGVEKARDRLREEERDRELARAVTATEGPWNDVRAAEQREADEIFRTFEDGLKKTEQACGDVLKGKDAPRVVAAVEKLSKQRQTVDERLKSLTERSARRWPELQSMYQDMEKQLWAHIEASKKLRRFDKDEMKQLIVAMCGADHERDDDEADRLASTMAGRIVDATRARRDDFVRSADAVEARLKEVYAGLRDFQTELETGVRDLEKAPGIEADELKPIRDTVDVVGKLREQDRAKFFGVLADDRSSYLNVASDNLLGSNNPRVEAAKRHGQKKHRDLQTAFACSRKEYAAGGGFADCVRFKDCTIWEFKPSSWTEDGARDDGAQYLSDVQRDFPKEDSEGKPWEQCWQPNGPTRGEGFEVRGHTYPQCTPDD